MSDWFLQVAVRAHYAGCFDYLLPGGVDAAQVRPGQRVRVPLGKSMRTGIVLDCVNRSDVDSDKLRAADALLDQRPLFSTADLELLQWAARYYRFPIGDVLFAALPRALRGAAAAELAGPRDWSLTGTGRAVDTAALGRAVRQRQLLEVLQQAARSLTEDELNERCPGWRPAMRALADKHWVEASERPCLPVPPTVADRRPAPPLNPDQQRAVDTLTTGLGRAGTWLLDGVTGSGKTEVYLAIAEQVIAQGRQVLVLVPEIGLTPQLIERFRSRLPVAVAVLHSALSEREHLCAWLSASRFDATGETGAAVVIGTRSAVWTPMPALGLIIVDEEHDRSLKQQEGFRYHARDIAVLRGQRGDIPVVLGSATPALETLHNCDEGKYQRVCLPRRAGEARVPGVSVVDVRGQRMQGNLSVQLLAAITRHLADGHQVLLFLNRRGFAPALLCHDCGWVSGCQRCDAAMTLHTTGNRLCCHHCGAERRAESVCPSCRGEELVACGHGTQRLESVLAAQFPEARVLRIDRDSTRRKGAMAAVLEQVHAGDADILVGTQMLAKGHDFPDVTLVGVVDADSGLFGFDFRASEEMAQLLTQVAGRSGRGRHAGEVLIQTHHPEHPLLQQLLDSGYAAFARVALAERQATGLPPWGRLALLRASAAQRPAAQAFLQRALAIGRSQAGDAIGFLGPVAAPMERRAGRYRMQLLVQAGNHAVMQRLFDVWVPELTALPEGRRVRWSLDVDPMEMF